MKQNILAVILAGGDSGRFWPLEEKIFFSIFGKPLLYHSLNRLKAEGIEEYLVVHSKTNEALLSKFCDCYPQFRIKKIFQKDSRGMAGAILSASSVISGRSILILGPEEVYEQYLVNGVLKSLKEDTQSLIVGYKTQTYLPGGYLEVKDCFVKRVVEKPGQGQEPSNLINIVFHYHKDANILLDSLKKVKSKKDDLYEKTLDQMIADEYKISFYPYSGFWGYLKYPWNVLDILNFYLETLKGQSIAKTAKIDSRATIKGAVFIGENVRILEYAKIVGPTYIGEGTVIGNNVMIRKSAIGKNCVVGFASEIGRSHIGDNCWFHTNFIGDSVISDNVSMGAGSILANVRLDEGYIKSKIGKEKMATGKMKLGVVVASNVRIGVNTSVMPGVKIGKGSFVGAGVVLDEDLKENKFCHLAKAQFQIQDNKAVLLPHLRTQMKNNLKFS